MIEVIYRRAAEDYLRRLPLSHFAESTTQGTQRGITLASLALIRSARPDVHYFNELLVQYPVPRRKRPGQVCPDNMVVIHDGPIEAKGSYDLPLQPVGPFMVLEYVSRNSKRKDYRDNRAHYEKHLKVPYCLLFYPEAHELTLLHHTGERYVGVNANVADRMAVPELELELAILDEWVRFWFRGELLPLPAELKRERDEARAEIVRLRAELQKARGKPNGR
jgi:hypothetical protein